MALFGTPNSYIGLDIGTSSIKLVEIVDRHKRLELVTYAQASMANLLLDQNIPEETATRQVANVVAHMMDKAGTSSDIAVAALPSTIIFSSVLNLPDLPQAEMDKAVHFAARDIVPSNLDDMVLDWSRIDNKPVAPVGAPPVTSTADSAGKNAQARLSGNKEVPIFLTAASKQIVDRYLKVLSLVHLKVEALEVEMFPLARALLSGPADSALIIDMGDLATTFHIIDRGTPRVSHTIEFGGHQMTEALARALNSSYADAEKQKHVYGLSKDTPPAMVEAMQLNLDVAVQKAKSLLQIYQQKEGRKISKSFLIGGGAGLRGLADFWSTALAMPTLIGNPWKGLTYPQPLEEKLKEIGPSYAVAVGLALRKLKS
jgi:type IV pilus assembly protein PilM